MQEFSTVTLLTADLLFRNECAIKLNDKIKTGDTIEIDIDANIIKNYSDGKIISLIRLVMSLDC